MSEQANAEYTLALADAQVKNKKYDIALNHLLEVIKSDPNKPDVLFAVCNVYAKKRFYTAAIEFCERTLNFMPQKIDAMNRLAWLYAKKRIKLKRGIELIQAVMQSHQNEAKYIDTFAELLFANGDIMEAIRNIKKAISIEPNNSYYKQQELRFMDTFTQPLDVGDF